MVKRDLYLGRVSLSRLVNIKEVELYRGKARGSQKDVNV